MYCSDRIRRPRGICLICGRSVALRKNGELRDHQGRSKKVESISGRKVYAWRPGSGAYEAP